jgi:hypothetical protein
VTPAPFWVVLQYFVNVVCSRNIGVGFSYIKIVLCPHVAKQIFTRISTLLVYMVCLFLSKDLQLDYVPKHSLNKSLGVMVKYSGYELAACSSKAHKKDVC